MARLSKRKAAASASQRASGKPLCSNLPRTLSALPAHLNGDPLRAAAIIETQSKWVNGTVLHYCFYTPPSRYAVPKVQAAAIRSAIAKWKAVGIGLTFKEVSDLSEAEVRIGYSEANGDSASAVGREVLNVPGNQPTTVYGWDLTSHYGAGTALHELGHVLGMEHEHQNPFAGIVWNEEAVYKSLGAPPNKWNRSTTFHNILEKLTPQQVQGSKWDPVSIMEYEFEAGLIISPKPYDRGLTPPGTLSKADKKWALKWYPPRAGKLKTLQPFKAEAADLAAGQQMDFAIKPTASRKYTLESRGASDSLMVLFEDKGGEARYLAGRDDSDGNGNARIDYKLFKGRNYVVRLKTLFPGHSGKSSLIYS